MIRILFAHQDPKFSQIYARHMQTAFQVDSVHDGLSAIRKFRLLLPQLVISDYQLPILSGLSFLKFVRSHPTGSTTPFVFLTNFDDNTQALNHGANDWITAANCRPDYLLERVTHHLKTNKHGIQIHRA